MNLKIQSTIAYFVLTMMVAVPWHMHFFHQDYIDMGAFTREQPIMPLGMLAVISQAIVFSYFFPIYLQNQGSGNRIIQGVKYSLLMGILVYTVMVFATAAKFNIEPLSKFLILGTLFQLIQFVLVGFGFGFVYRKY